MFIYLYLPIKKLGVYFQLANLSWNNNNLCADLTNLLFQPIISDLFVLNIPRVIFTEPFVNFYYVIKD